MPEADLTADSALIARAQAGDAAARNRLVEQHREAVFRLAYLLLGSADDAEDVAQETFIRAFARLDRLDPARPARPWFLRIAANLARNRYRAWWRYRRRTDQFTAEAGERISSPEAETHQQMQARELWHAVQRLPRKQQEVVYLRYFLDLSVQETAEALSVPEGTVKSRQHRALIALRDLIEADYPGLVEGMA